MLLLERADTSIVRFDYDENGNMTLLVTPKPADNSFTHNKVNNRSSYLTHLGSTTTYTYNPERQLTEVTLPSTKKIINTYVDSRLTETTTEEWTNVYEYACGDLLDSVTRGGEVLSYDYDGSLVTDIFQTGTLTQDLGFVYNNDFNLTGFSYAGATESYTYDNDGLLTGAGDFTVARNAVNGLPESVFDGTFTLNRTFSSYGEMDTVSTTVSGSTVFSYDLVRNNSGRITTKTEMVDGTASESVYTYDDLGRLLTVTKDSALTEEYRYDDNGNRTYETNTALGITGRTFTYSTEDHIMDAGGIIYEFDLDDNLAAKTEGTETTEYNYSSTGELISVTLPDGTAITYIQDPNGRRIAKKVNDSIVEKYLWSGQTTLLAIYDASDNLLQRFEYADDRVPVAMTAGGSAYYFVYDQVGSLRLVTDSSGAVVKRIDYDTFGNILDETNAGFTVPFGFAGGLHDRDIGLVRFGFRDYMPEIGRWTAKDPILFAGGDTNLYGYVGNDPVNFVDPTGKILITGTIAVTAAIYAGEAAIGISVGIILGGVISEQFDNWFASEGDSEGDSECPLNEVSGHANDRRDEARKGDNTRQVGDPNRAVRDGREFIDSETGNTVHVKGDRVVITDGNGKQVTQFKNSRKNTQKRIRSQKWIPK